MQIQTAAPPKPPAPKPPKKDESFWHEFSNDVRSFFLYSDHQRFQEASQLLKNITGGIRSGWKVISSLPEKIFNLPGVKDNVADNTRDDWSEWSERVGLYAGFAAAGGQAVLGATKLVSGFRQGNTGRKIDGLVDLATASALGVTVAGLAGARLVLAPLAAGINMIRGGYNAATGWTQHNERKQLQGALDLTRSFGAMGRILEGQSAVMNGIGIAFAPIAGAIQAGRGLHDVRLGLKNHDKKMIVRGLVDVATAVGTGLAFASGAAVIPGVALAVVANGAKVAYQLSPRFRGFVDRKLDKAEPKLEKLLDKANSWSQPVLHAWKKLMTRLFPEGEAPAPEQFSRAELTEVTRLLFADGQYSKDEYNRLKSTLEETGQVKQLPPLKSEVPESRRADLLRQLSRPEQRREFLEFMLVVADYDYTVKPEEKAYVQGLADDLGIDQATLDQMIEDTLHRRLNPSILPTPSNKRT